ncbi:hypothetical protein [Micromonospora mirobrigensis]|uniref:Uncharacterized protein n=1 Tax=Micromonospora mirobrigensis TaxID=262898 RepID=A0A1C4YW60_9ACTN|nr:hypothetical protein [Micromonospora mirobrigensis]SCF24914.1 hypothetical protein GA0070564_104452 [Micromonospora mirobrigensis]
MSRPPYGRDGQWVRIVSTGGSTDPEDAVDLGAVAVAHWFGAEGAWFVTVAGSGTGIHPGECLDFAPEITEVEATELRSWLGRSTPPSS